MKVSVCKNYNEAKVLGVSPSSGYELMYQPDFAVPRVGSCIVVLNTPLPDGHLNRPSQTP